MKRIHRTSLRLVAATVLSVAVIGLSTLAMHAPTQTQNLISLKSIQTDSAATFYADHRPNCAWFREMILPTGDSKLAAKGPPGCAWFREMVLAPGDNNVMSESLKSVAATL
jgi:hypothetical protein